MSSSGHPASVAMLFPSFSIVREFFGPPTPLSTPLFRFTLWLQLLVSVVISMAFSFKVSIFFFFFFPFAGPTVGFLWSLALSALPLPLPPTSPLLSFPTWAG